MSRAGATVLGVMMAVLAGAAGAQDVKPAEPAQIDALQKEIEQLKAEVERLRAENAALKEQLAAKAADPSQQQPPPPLVLGPADQNLGSYAYAAPAGWNSQQLKNINLSMMYRSPDKSGLILMQVKPKGAAPPEHKAQYGQRVIEMLKRDFAKRQTEVIEAPKIVKDDRFYLKIQEKLRIKGDTATVPPKTGTQVRLYRVIGPDMIELTAMTTSESSDQINGLKRLAEEMVLGVKPKQ